MSLIFENVNFRYGAAGQGVQDINLEIATGELLAVIGPSGSGKSTLLRLVSGLLSGHSGRIRLGNKDLSGVPVHQRDIGMVFQSYALFPHLSVLDNVAYGLKMRGVPTAARHARAAELLATVGLADFAQRSPARLSGGQQQRVALARALAFGPQALLLDEPLAALDASIRGHLRDQIRELQQRFKATTLFVTHDQEEALTMADRIALLDGGRLVQVDTPQNLYQRPVNSTVARFVGLSTLLDATVRGAGEVDVGYAILRTDTAGRRPGQAVKVLIRPEHVQPHPEEAAVNRLPGRVSAQRYLGSLIRYDFLPQGATTPWLAEAASLPGHSISVGPEHLRLLDD
jgi:putative spermidine/putrescine transport system ATP-binding protein